MLYILTIVWMLRTPNAGQNSHFQHFFSKKLKKRKKVRNLLQNCAKTDFLILFLDYTLLFSHHLSLDGVNHVGRKQKSRVIGLYHTFSKLWKYGALSLYIYKINSNQNPSKKSFSLSPLCTVDWDWACLWYVLSGLFLFPFP